MATTNKTVEEQLGVSKNEKVCEQYSDIKGVLRFVKTHNVPLRDTYYLYEVIDGKCVKTKHKAENPLELNKWIKGK